MAKKEYAVDIKLGDLVALKAKLIEVYGNDMEVYKNMNMYTNSWASTFADNQISNGDLIDKADNLDKWLAGLHYELMYDEDIYIAFFGNYKDLDAPTLRVYIIE